MASCFFPYILKAGGELSSWKGLSSQESFVNGLREVIIALFARVSSPMASEAGVKALSVFMLILALGSLVGIVLVLFSRRAASHMGAGEEDLSAHLAVVEMAVRKVGSDAAEADNANRADLGYLRQEVLEIRKAVWLIREEQSEIRSRLTLLNEQFADLGNRFLAGRSPQEQAPASRTRAANDG